MDVPTVLSTLASIAASLVGFSGLLTAFRTANQRFSAYDMNNVRSLLIVSVSALIFALLPLPLEMFAEIGWAWPALTILLGANLLFWSVQSPRWMKHVRLKPRRPLLYAVMIAAQGLVGALLIAGAVMVEKPAPLYCIGVLWLLIAAIVIFVVQIFLMLPVAGPPVEND